MKLKVNDVVVVFPQDKKTIGNKLKGAIGLVVKTRYGVAVTTICEDHCNYNFKFKNLLKIGEL